MKERGEIFTGPEVRAILDGTKTQVRRVIKSQPEDGTDCPYHIGEKENRRARVCPYGVPGDRLWVRETWAMDIVCGEGEYPYESETVLIKWKADNSEWVDHGDADIPCDFRFTKRKGWRSPIYMSRWASRIDLEITAVRVERLQDISEEDAKAEGAPDWNGPPIHGRFGCMLADDKKPTNYLPAFGEFDPHRLTFCQIWNSINAKRGFGWDVNPWVWVIEFKRIKP